jgi:hypothetical protein
VRNNNNNNNNKSDLPVGHNAQDLVKRRIRPGESFESVFARGDIEGNGRDGTRRRCAGVLGATTDRHWCWLLSLAIQNSPWHRHHLCVGFSSCRRSSNILGRVCFCRVRQRARIMFTTRSFSAMHIFNRTGGGIHHRVNQEKYKHCIQYGLSFV